MPSGFQQDSNQLTPSYYRVVIACGSGSAQWYAVGDGNEGGTNEGRISPYSWDNYEGSNLPSTQAKADALARGNLRFQHIIEAVENLSDCQILDVETNAGSTADEQADNQQIAFTIKFDRDEGVLPAVMAMKKAQNWDFDGTIDYDNVTYPQYYTYVGNGSQISGPSDAIRDIIYLALSQYNPTADSMNERTRSARVYHVNTGAGYQEVVTTATPWDNNSNAFGDITVNEIDGTTTTLTSDDDAQ